MRVLFLIFGICVAAFGIDSGAFNNLENGLYVLFSLTLIVLLILFLYFNLRENFIKNSKKTTDVYFGQKIDVFKEQSEEQDGNLIQRISFYFFVIHKKATLKNNKVVFKYPLNQNIMFKADFDQICYITHSICNFLLDICENTTITLQINPIEKDESTTTCRFYFNINNPLSEHKDKIIDAIDGKNSNYTYNELKKISNLVKNIDIGVSQSKYRNITFTTNKSRSNLSFDIMLKNSYMENNYKINEKFHGLNLKAVILDSDIDSYRVLNHQLRLFGISTLNKIDAITAIEHIFDDLYGLNFLFINIQNIANKKSRDNSEDKISIKEIIDQMKIKNFFTIIISNNEADEKYFEVFRHEKDCFLIKQPYNVMKIHDIITDYISINNIKLQGSGSLSLGGGE